MRIKSALIVLFAVSIIGSVLDTSNAEDAFLKKYFPSVIKKPGYKAALALVMADVKIDGQWKKMILDGDVVSGPVAEEVVDGKSYEILKICFPRRCDEYSTVVAFEHDGKNAVVYFYGTELNRGFAGNPSENLKGHLARIPD